MSEKSRLEKTDFFFETGGINGEQEEKSIVERMEDKPFQIVILGDFSGRRNRGAPAGGRGLREPEIIAFDRYDFSNLFKLLKPELRLPPLSGEDSPISLGFEEMDDFHPDKLVERIPFLNKLAEISRDLESGSAFERAFNELQAVAAEFESIVGRGNFAFPKEELKDTEPSSLKHGELDVSRQLGSYSFQGFLNQTLSSYLTKEITPQQEEIISVFKEFAGAWLRGVIHHPDFQSLEASWRSLRFLAARLEANPDLKLCLIDISKEEISDDFSASERVEESLVYKLLVENVLTNPEAEPWTVLAGDYFFGDRPEDIRCLKAMGGIARLAQASFIAGADPAIVVSEMNSQTRDSKVAEEWRSLRLSPEAGYIGLIVPRFLLRLPYGRETSCCESMDFEELSSLDSHQEYLWGNASFLGACLLGESFLKFGWKFGVGLLKNIEGLPLHVYRREGETKLKPCAEVVLSLKELQAIERLGLIPLYSIPDSDEVCFGDLSSLALPVSRLRISGL